MIAGRVVVVGAGRVGRSLARALGASGSDVVLLGRAHRAAVDADRDGTRHDWPQQLGAAGTIVLAVPDDALSAVAAEVAATGVITSTQIVLHTSGLHDHAVLDSLRPTGASLGSWHPLQSFADVTGDAAIFDGVTAVVEGDDSAIAAARGLSTILGMAPVIVLGAGKKALYHAGAVFASNYLVVLADIAARLAREAGASGAVPALFIPLMQQSIANLAAGAPAALTGPVRRGDVGTVAAHLTALSGNDRTLYLLLAREALRLAAEAGLGSEQVQAMEAVLRY